jgi:hypothetical protein
MLAVDANIIVRNLTRDEARDGRCADPYGEDVSSPRRCPSKPEWVLHRAYRFSCERVIAALATFAGPPRVTLEDAASTAKALDWTRRGMDFADALQLAKLRGCKAFAGGQVAELRIARPPSRSCRRSGCGRPNREVSQPASLFFLFRR